MPIGIIFLAACRSMMRPFLQQSLLPGLFLARTLSGRWTMPRFCRQTLIVTMLTLYGLVSVCGSGLHALMDPVASHATSGPADSVKGPLLRAMSGHCPICEFQAQGQLAVEPARLVSRPHTSPHVALILAMVASRDRHPSCSPRAPPLSLLSVV
jgi:hypothetical protein